MDDPNIEDVTDLLTVTNVPTNPVVPTDWAVHTERTLNTPFCNKENVVSVTNFREHASSSHKEPVLRAVHWFYLILVFLWIFAAITLPIVAFCITKNPLCLSGFT